MRFSTVIEPEAGTSRASDPPIVELRAVSKGFPGIPAPLSVLRDVNLAVSEGELVTFFGPNGCGKTTLLNVIAGLAAPDSGAMTRNGGACDSPVGYVFQNHADTLLPWRTVYGNLAFPLELQRAAAAGHAKRIADTLRLFHLQEHSHKYAYELSGGLKQLLSIARAAVYDPRLLLLDEPFSALDYSLSRMFWIRFREFWAQQRITTLFVSHNVDEAVFLGDRVCVLSARPAHIVADIHVPFGPDRKLDLLGTPEFFAVRAKVLEAFDDGRGSR